MSVVAAVFLIGGPALAETQQPAYRLGPTEQIGLRAVVWDSTQAAFVELEAMRGTYSIAADGQVMLPIVGALDAGGATTADLAGRVSRALQERTGLNEAPSVAIEILRHRPVFILGEVAQPGQYEYQPGLRAIQLLSMAGGYYRLPEERAGGRASEAIRLGGELRALRAQLAGVRIREARLAAEAENENGGAAGFALPEDIVHPEGAAAVQQIYDRELSLMQARQDAFERSIASLESSRALLESETRVLTEKRGGIQRQIELMSESVGNIETLAERGLVRSPSLVNMQQALIDLQARDLDAETQLFRAAQTIGEMERDLNDVRQRRATEVLTALQADQATIVQLDLRREMLGRLLQETRAEMAQVEADTGIAFVPVFRITRETDGQAVTEIGGPQSLLSPLDVLEIEWAELGPGGAEAITN
ncbi:polysaccharide biosynthesis/export family protein [Limimaricola sp.]|uniref:polysaccharide biosynthesis/export family protein n=1 Tax=Limimaricola sp. TaxID=2211665 RepID=UPI0040595BE0